jgi:glutamate N-acetyltransferase/amino-acid N-acetyltransferase
MQEIEGGGITSPKGFHAAGMHAGIKSDGASKDLSLVLSTVPATAAAVYTKNLVQAAPILVDREHLQDGIARAVILNSGNANACTGEAGMEHARRMCAATAAALGLVNSDVLVCSTGLIGATLPIEKIETGIPLLAGSLSQHGGMDAALGIMTTDTIPKQCAVQVELEVGQVTVGAIAKGAAMIAPNMATMLALVSTDARVPGADLQTMLSQAIQRTFNCITVDGDMSTNDTVIAMANGAALADGVQVVADSTDGDKLGAAIEAVCSEMAKAIARDAEGSTKLITIEVSGARAESEARQVGLSVANSNLVKTAVFGCDPNWGRILCAIGYAGVDLDPERVQVQLCGTLIYANGVGTAFDEATLSAAMQAADIPIHIDLGSGSESAQIFTCDLTYDYVRLNAEYKT